ncbi:hypothetical protein [Variovorax sp. GT1P44]|uniref:hypothetical protein n=1 Tax=Variovorax sp. GT1P44 TaxID=3443742 RepID=UPI003F45B19F
MLMSFSPFIAFALLSRYLPVTAALLVGAAVAVALIVRDRVHHGRSVKILEVGTALLFGGLALFVLATGGAWSIVEVRFAVDAGLLLIVVISMLLRRPFTLQYARERVSPEVAALPQFAVVNYVLTGVWALAFLAMTMADFVMARMPAVPLWIGVAVTVAAIAGAAWFTGWYPERRRRQAEAAGRIIA